MGSRNPYIIRISVGFWVVALAVLALVRIGGFPVQSALGADKSDSSGEPLTYAEALSSGQAWASKYLASTNGPEFGIELSDMTLSDAMYHENVDRAMTSVSSGISFGDQKMDFWSFSWEKEGVRNAATGRNDGTAYIVVVVIDRSGKIAAAKAGVRQPEEQARARGPLPTYDERYGSPPSEPWRCGEIQMNGQLQSCEGTNLDGQ